jgi:hypothetical protein
MAKKKDVKKKLIKVDMMDVQIGQVISHPLPILSMFRGGKWLVLYIGKDSIIDPRNVNIIRIGKVSRDGVFTSRAVVQEFHEKITGKHLVNYYGHIELYGKLK